jgi:hypothetical protein
MNSIDYLKSQDMTDDKDYDMDTGITIDDKDSNMDIDTDIKNCIGITQFIEQVSQIMKSPNKDDFIKSYQAIHQQIKQIDEILYEPSSLNESTDIKTLFDMLKEYESILNQGNITVVQYKKMLDLVNLLETKISNSSMDVKELKDM